jgi:hypothetical protein
MPPPIDPSAIDGAAMALRQAYEQLAKAREECAAQYDRIVGEARSLGGAVFVTGGTALLPVTLVGAWAIDNSLDRLHDAVRRGLEVADKVLQHGTPVVSLFLVSIDVLTKVRAPVSGMSGRVEQPQDDNLLYWTGQASDAYKIKREKQKNAVDRVAANAAALSEWLYKVGQYNVDYAVRIVQSLAEAALKMVSVAVNAIGVIGLPFALDKLAETINGLVNVCVQELVGLASRFAQVIGDVQRLTAQQSDRLLFTDGGWPQAVFPG